MFQVGGQTGDKELAIGDGFMRVEHGAAGLGLVGDPAQPGEQPFPGTRRSSRSRSITRARFVDQRHRFWVIYWFVVSMVAAFCFPPGAQRQSERKARLPWILRSSSSPACRAPARRS